MLLISQENENLEIFEFQGEFENIELFDGIFDKEKLQMKFKGFSLQGKVIKKEFTILEKVENDFKQKGTLQEVILFNQPPRYNF